MIRRWKEAVLEGPTDIFRSGRCRAEMVAVNNWAIVASPIEARKLRGADPQACPAAPILDGRGLKTALTM